MNSATPPSGTDVQVTLAAQQDQIDDLTAAVDELQRALAALEARQSGQDPPQSGRER